MKYISLILLFPFLFKGCFGELESNDHRLTFTNSGNSILYGAISQDKLDNSTNIVDYTVPKTAKTEFVEFNQEKSFGGEGANYWTDFVNNSKSKSVNILL